MLQLENICKWSNTIRREQGLVEVKQAKFLAEDKPSKRTKNSANGDGLANLVLSYFHRSPMEFLQGIVYNLTFGTNKDKYRIHHSLLYKRPHSKI